MAFITNTPEKGKSLATRLKEIIPKSYELKFLTGFFYFSGLTEFYQTLKKLDEERKITSEFLKILVGLEVDKNIYGIYEYSKEIKNNSLQTIKQNYFESLKKVFNTKEFDKKEIYEQVEFFIKLLQEGRLVIRKTREPNHSKLYIFKLNDNITPHLFITGSSNLTYAGLVAQNEFNVEIKDYGFQEAEEYFDRLWEDSIEFSYNDVKRIVEILEKETFLRKITPFEAWVYVLMVYLQLQYGRFNESYDYVKKIFEDAGYRPYSYQIEAVLQALKMCNNHNGVLLADVVGLGKTVIACAVAKMLNKKGIVICPPHLVGDEFRSFGWRKYLKDFKLYEWEVHSLGMIDKVLESIKKDKDIEVVIVDEAHRFRNENTKRYHYLHEICRGKIVILLTATPFNNQPSDIFSLLKLFTIPKKSTIVLDQNLEVKFYEYQKLFEKLSYIKNYINSPADNQRKQALKYYKEIFKNNIKFDKNKIYEIYKEVNIESRRLSKCIRQILEPIIIRRNRLDLQYYGEKIDIPEVSDPLEWFFELTSEQSEFYDKIIEIFNDIYEGGKFTGAIYFPIKYEKGQDFQDVLDYEYDYEYYDSKISKEENFMFLSQRNLYNFMRRLIVKRFESSFYSFIETINHFINIHDYAIKFVEQTGKFILNRKLMEEFVEDEEQAYEELKKYEEQLRKNEIDSKYHKIYEINNFKLKDEFIRDLKKDKRLFEEIKKEFDKLELLENDPKFYRLVKGIEKYLQEKRKVVIFTEYVDTAKYLQERLEKLFQNKVLCAVGNLSGSLVESIYKNFDAQYDIDKQEDQYYILLATDKLSEGFNLNRAGVVINYDIPWNPVKVIQRVGRINRIGKKVYDKIYIVNFFPTEKGANITKSREIAQNKMFMIHKVLGEDSKIFSPDEEPNPSLLYQRLTSYKEDEEENLFTKLNRYLDSLKQKYPSIFENIKNMPFRVKVAKEGEKDELVVIIKKSDNIFVGYKDYNQNSVEILNFEDAIEKIRVEDPYQELLLLSENFWKNYSDILELRISDTKPSKLAKEAFNVIKALKNEKKFESYMQFISNIEEDLIEYGTLSEYVLRQIVKWDQYYKNQNFEQILEDLEQIKKDLGEDFIEKAKKYFKNTDNTVIVAIENRKI